MKDRITFHFDNCPFCGSLKVKCFDEACGMGDHIGKIFYVFCQKCGAKGPDKLTEMDANQAWNSREN